MKEKERNERTAHLGVNTFLPFDTFQRAEDVRVLGLFQCTIVKRMNLDPEEGRLDARHLSYHGFLVDLSSTTDKSIPGVQD